MIKQSRTISRVAARACAALVLVVLAACPGGDGGGGTGPDTRVTQVVVTGPGPSVEAGAAIQLSASARNAGGASVGGSFTWSSSNSAVATVATNGEVQGAAAGTATITATETGSGVAGSMGVTVVPAAVQSVVVEPAAASLQLGRTQTLTATLRDARGTVVTGRAVAWTTSNPAIATVTGAGVVTAMGVGGPVTITANAEGRNGTAQITVLPAPIATLAIVPAGPHTLAPGATLTLNAVARDDAGNALTGRALSWTSSDPAVASVSGTGVVTALLPGGPVTITATSEGVSATVQVTVGPAPVATVTVSPSQQTLMPGATFQFAAVARDALLNPLTGRAVTWTISNSSVATVSATGLVAAQGAGQATLTATVEGRTGTAQITVTPSPVATLAIVPAGPHTLVAGATLTLNAVARDAAGNALTGRALSWTSSDPAVASVSGTGVVTGITTGGPVAITATSEGVSATVQVTVERRPVATVSIAPAGPFTLMEGATLTLNAVARDAQGNALTGRTLAWSSSNPVVAAISATGVITASEAGVTNISATVEGVTAAAQLTVERRPIVSVQVTGVSRTVVQGGTVQFNAIARDAQGDVLIGRGFTWTTSDRAIATVSTTGLVTGHLPGDVFITATAEGRGGAASLSVIAPTASRVTVSPNFVTLGVTETRGLSATAADADGVAIPSPAVTWSTLSAPVASVNSAGVVRGESIGVTRVVAQVNAATDTSFIAVVGPGSLLSTAFIGGEIRADLVPGSLVTVPVTLDMTRANSNGDLGAAQFELRYDPALLQYQSAQPNVAGSGETHSPTPGTVRFAYAGTAPQGRPVLTLVTLTFRVAPSAPVGAYSTFVLNYTAPPVSTSFQSYTTPVSVWGRMRIVAP